MVIAIDGPAGSGKSTIARMLAKRLGFKYLDTGAMYRAFTWKVLQSGIDLHDENSMCKLMGKTVIELKTRENDVQVFVDGINVTREIRTPFIANNVHYISEKAGIRQQMVTLQKNFAIGENIVAEGRDMCTVVFPQAKYKFFLDAKIEARAKRRHAESHSTQNNSAYTAVVKDMEARDLRDATRNNSPLIRDSKAIYIDTTELAIEEVLHEILGKITPATT